MSERKRHCWRDGPSISEWLEANPDADIDSYVGSTCMLERGHEGPHEFTPDSNIGVTFAPEEPQP